MTTYTLGLYPGGLKRERLEDLLEKTFGRILGSADRRNELGGVAFEFRDPEKPRDGDVFLGVLGTPQALVTQVGKTKDVKSLLVVMPDNAWGDDMRTLMEHPFLVVEAVIRASHLGIQDGKAPDASEELLLEQALLRMVRHRARPQGREEDFSKPVDWKMKLAPGKGAQLFSVFADPAMKALLEDTKAAIRHIKGREDRDRIKGARKGMTCLPKKNGKSIFESLPEVAWEGRLPSMLLLGESGTGKTLLAAWIARAIFGPEERVERMNMTAIPAELVDSELFGAKAGAFTDHPQDSLGFFLQHRGKVLFLDEIGDMEPGHQARLLAYMDDGMVRPTGCEDRFPAPAVVVAATNRPVEAWVEAKDERFRGDLLARFDHVVRIPPLRERTADLRLLISLVLQDEEVNPRTVERISLEAIDFLERQSYSGNFRELRTKIQRGVRRAEREGSSTLGLRHLVE